MITAGIDAGSRSTKVVLLDSGSARVLASTMADQAIDQAGLSEKLLCRACAESNLERGRIDRIVATGYGRNAIRVADQTITEITCHARGVRQLVPATRTIIEIGGQDSKCIFLEENGRVRDFNMNDRCAAGSGRFLEVLAGRLGINVSELCSLTKVCMRPAAISSMCVVFAETEIIGLLAQGASPSDIAAGVQKAIAGRVAGMVGRNCLAPVCFTGGVALQDGMVRALEEALSSKLCVCPQPQFTGALGAALLAAER